MKKGRDSEESSSDWDSDSVAVQKPNSDKLHGRGEVKLKKNEFGKQIISPNVSQNFDSLTPSVTDKSTKKGVLKKKSMDNLNERAYGSTYQQRGMEDWKDSDAEERTLAMLQANITMPNCESQRKSSVINIKDSPHLSCDNSPVYGGIQPPAEFLTGGHTSSSNIKLHEDKRVIFSENMEGNGGSIESEKLTNQPIYRFDYGDAAYLKLKYIDDNSFMRKHTDGLQLKYHKWWVNVLSSLRIVIDFVLSFVLAILGLLFGYILKPLIVGIVHIFGEMLIKPTVAVCFNSCLQPYMVCSENFFALLFRTLTPFFKITKEIIHQLATLLSSIRFVGITINNHPHKQTVENV